MVLPALVISTVLYLLLSQWFPLNYENSLLSDTIHFIFNIDWTLWIPVIIVIGLLPLKVSIRWPIGLSALAAAILAYTNQGATISELGWYTLTGFELPHYNPLADIIHGGGLQTNVHSYPLDFYGYCHFRHARRGWLLERCETTIRAC